MNLTRVVAPWSTHKMRLLTLFYLLSSCFGKVKSSRMVIWITASLTKVQRTQSAPIPRPFTFAQMPRLYHPCSSLSLLLLLLLTLVLHQGTTAIQPNENLQLLSEERENKIKLILKQCTKDIIDNISAKQIRFLISNIFTFRALGC